jgi:hypothetical protein
MVSKLDAYTASSDYIQLHAGDKATIAESLAFIQQTASSILRAFRSPSRATPNANPTGFTRRAVSAIKQIKGEKNSEAFAQCSLFV